MGIISKSVKKQTELFTRHLRFWLRSKEKKMQFILSNDFLTATDPVQPVRDDKLMYQLINIKSQCKGGYLQAAEKIVDPLCTLVGRNGSSVVHDGLADNEHLKKVLLSEHRLLSLHLAEKNGDFVRQVARWCHLFAVNEHKWITVPSNSALLSQVLGEPEGMLLADCDLTMDIEMDRVISQCSQLATPISVITAELEEKTEPAQMNQVLIALATLREGGLAIFTIGEFYHHQIKLILWLLFSLFDKVLVRKPATSGRSTNTKFVTCSGYQRQRYIDQYESLFVSVRQNPSVIEFPLSWSYWLTQQQNLFTLQKEAALLRSLQVTAILLRCNPGFTESQLQRLVERCFTDKNMRARAVSARAIAM